MANSCFIVLNTLFILCVMVYSQPSLLYHRAVSCTPLASVYLGLKPNSRLAGVMSHRQLRWLRMLYLSLFSTGMWPVILPQRCPAAVISRRSHSGAFMRSRRSTRSSRLIRSLNVRDEYVSPSLIMYDSCSLPPSRARKAACTTSFTNTKVMACGLRPTEKSMCRFMLLNIRK